MNLSSVRVGAVALLAAMSVAACDAGNVLLWPWVETDKSADNAGAPPPPPPPLSPVDPLDPDAVQTVDAVPNPNANTGAPVDGTPFTDGKPENPNIDTGDSKPPVSAETGEELPPLPAPTEEASTPTTPPEPPVTPPETPPATPPPAPTPVTHASPCLVLLLPVPAIWRRAAARAHRKPPRSSPTWRSRSRARPPWPRPRSIAMAAA